MKTCTLCERSLKPAAFHKDKSSKDGFSARCKECRNAARKDSKALKKVQATPIAKAPEKTIVAPKESHSVPILSEDDSDILQKVRQKFNCHFSLSIDRNGNSRLQVHQNPTLTFKSDTPEGVIQNALAFS